ncbi:MAG TPA: hypothetical protein VMM13_04140, partial [Euzebya sp.]|nr:hypothetical protein [Euzebya sp.]
MRIRVMGILVLVLALLATACSDGENGATTDEATDGAAVATADETATEPETEEPSVDDTEATDDESAAEEPVEDATEAVVRTDADLVIWADETRVQALQPFADQFGEDNGISVALQELEFDE